MQAIDCIVSFHGACCLPACCTGWLFPEQQLQQPSSVSALVAPLFAMIFDAPVDQFTVASLLFIVVYNAAIVSWWQYQWELTTAGHFDIESFDHAVSLVHDAAQHVRLSHISSPSNSTSCCCERQVLIELLDVLGAGPRSRHLPEFAVKSSAPASLFAPPSNAGRTG